MADPLEYMVHGTWVDKEAWDRAHQTTPEFKTAFTQLPIERHSLARGSFFEEGQRLKYRALGSRDPICASKPSERPD